MIEGKADERIGRTLKSLEESGFNKIRFCIFPKHYDYNLKEPRSYPYEGTPMDSRVLTKENCRYRKPVVLDEIAYEGNIQYGWGNITGEEMVRRFWEAACRGGYPGHGETYLADDDVLWWSHGGRLYGESWKRVKFLHRILCETPGIGLAQKQREWDEICAVPEEPHAAARTGYHLIYYSFMRPSFRDFHFDDENEYAVEVIDTWNMTIEKAGTFKGKFRVKLPGRPYMAICIRKA